MLRASVGDLTSESRIHAIPEKELLLDEKKLRDAFNIFSFARPGSNTEQPKTSPDSLLSFLIVANCEGPRLRAE